jgi:adenine-specific DNA-methyltransferase
MPSAPPPESTKRYQSVTEEKAGGATYTPFILADFVAEQIVSHARLEERTSIRILDPAVGDGELLLSLLTRLHSRIDVPIYVYGFDTDAAAVCEARRRLFLACPQVDFHLEFGNFLEFVLEQGGALTSSSSLFAPRERESFDLIIANPPYVRTQIMGATRAQDLANAFGLSGRVDLYHAFLIGMARVLRPDGTAGIIVSNRFMTTKGGSSLRAALRDGFSLRHIWDLGDTKIFDAAVLPAVILADGRNGHEVASSAFTSIYATTEPTTIEAVNPVAALALVGPVVLPDGRRFRVQHGTLDDAGPKTGVWRIATKSGDAWLATVVSNSWGSFRDVGKIRVGVKTCADKVYIRSDWSTLADSDQPELLRPVTTHHIAGRFRSIPTAEQRLILYPHEKVQERRRPVDLALYPKARAYLEIHRATLEGRKYVIDGGRKWYELWVPQDPGSWVAPKLVFKDISERPTFWLDLDGTIVNGDCYWLTCDRSDQADLLWLAAAVANSTFAEAFYDHRFNNKLYAGRRRFITQYVEQFPLPDPETPLARDIIAGAKAIYEVAPFAEDLETKLDLMVWEAFGVPIKKSRSEAESAA